MQKIAVGFATNDHLRQMALRGYAPHHAHNAIAVEARRRYPMAVHVEIARAPDDSGFNIYVVRP